MKRSIYLILTLFFAPIISFSQGAMLQAKIVNSAPLEATVIVKATNYAASNNSSTGCVINVGVGIPKIGNETAPTIQVVSLIGGTTSSISSEQLTVESVDYWAFGAVIDQAGFAPLNAGEERSIYKVTFPATVSGRLPRAIHSVNTNNIVEFDMFWPGSVPVVINPIRFYGGSVMDNDDTDGELYVEVPVALPITILEFKVGRHSNSSSLVYWNTSKELNPDYFDIERSQDSRSWESIGTVKAKGDSKSRVSYEFIDDKITLSRSKENIYYYRLRMVDRDGQFTYSEIRDVNFGRLKTPDLMIHPNPTNDIINLDLTIFDKNDGPIEITVYDMNGKQVLNKVTSDTGSETIDISSLPSETYNLVVIQGEMIYKEKIVKVD